MADELEAEFARDAILQRLDRLVAELDDASAFHIDEMVVVAARSLLVASALVAEVVALEDAFLGEQLQRAIDGRQRDMPVDLVGALIDLLDVGMVLGCWTTRGR